MDPAITALLAASIAFVGLHFAMSHPLRAPLVARLGEGGFIGVYSLVSLATFAWMVLAFRAAPLLGLPVWSGQDEVSWTIASALTIVATVLFLGSFARNPALPGMPVGDLATREPSGVFRVTRHPMMWGFALWALAHIIVAPTSRTLVLAGSIGFLALVGAHLQDRKKAGLLGPAWTAWEAKTHYWPRWRELPRAGFLLWSIAVALWLALTWAHIKLAYVPAGVWRWAG